MTPAVARRLHLGKRTTLATGSATAGSAATLQVRLRPARGVAKRLTRARSLTATLRATVTPTGSKAAAKAITVRFRR